MGGARHAPAGGCDGAPRLRGAPTGAGIAIAQAGHAPAAPSTDPESAGGTSANGNPDRAVPGAPVVPSQPRFLRLDGLRISYVDVGDGPTILLLHGLGHSTHGWRKLYAPLANAGYRVMAVDLPGFGYSDKPGNYTLQSFVDFVRAWLDLHVIDHAAVMGNSMGGMITAAVAGMAPERVSAAVLVDPAGFGRHATWLIRLSGLRLLHRAIDVRYTPWSVRRALRYVFADPSLIEDEEVARIIELSRLPGARRAMREISGRSVGLGGLRPGMGLGDLPEHIDTPALVVWGSRDRVVPPSHADLVCRVIPHAQLVVLDGVGHCPQLEAPQRLVEAVVPFLAEHHPPAAAAKPANATPGAGRD